MRRGLREASGETGRPGGRRGAALAVAIVGVMLGGGCGKSAPDATINSPPKDTASLTTAFVPEAQVAPRATPVPKPTTTVAATSTTAPRQLPAGFPSTLPLPAGNVGFYTGSPELGFHLNLSTSLTFSELVNFFTDRIEARPAWGISVRDVGQGFLGGFEGVWAIYTAPDHVLTQLTGPYPGVIEVEDRHVNILLDPPAQPEPGAEPPALPGRDVLPRPDTPLQESAYSSGIVKIAYGNEPGGFDSLVDAYRRLQWSELVAIGREEPRAGFAAGELLGWRVTIEESQAAGLLLLDFENRALSYP